MLIFRQHSTEACFSAHSVVVTGRETEASCAVLKISSKMLRQRVNESAQ